MKKIILSLVVLLGLQACSEIELGSHLVKTIPNMGEPEEKVGYFKVGSPYRIKGRTYRPHEKYQYSETGIASWYGPGFHGKMTANGEIFNKNDLTAAHRTLQMPSIVRVTNLENGKSIIVRVNDRGPFAHDRVIDLSEKAATTIGMKHQGTARVRVDVLEIPSRQVASASKNGQSTRGVEIALNRGQSIHEDMPLMVAKPASKPNHNNDNNMQTATYHNVNPSMMNKTQDSHSMFDDMLIKQAQANPVKKPIKARPVVPNQDIFVQTGAFANEDNALTMKMALQNLSDDVHVYRSVENDGAVYRVKIGPVSNVDEAEKIASVLTKQGRKSKIIVVDQ